MILFTPYRIISMLILYAQYPWRKKNMLTTLGPNTKGEYMVKSTYHLLLQYISPQLVASKLIFKQIWKSKVPKYHIRSGSFYGS